MEFLRFINEWTRVGLLEAGFGEYVAEAREFSLDENGCDYMLRGFSLSIK